jgi:hypothetical protein
LNEQKQLNTILKSKNTALTNQNTDLHLKINELQAISKGQLGSLKMSDDLKTSMNPKKTSKFDIDRGEDAEDEPFVLKL